MTYTDRNFKSGKALKEAFQSGELIGVYQPGGMFGPEVKDGWTVIEGPHYPQPHKFYVQVEVKNGVIVEIKGVK